MDAQESLPARPPKDRGVRLGSLTIDVSSWVYGTITLMSVLAVYDGWTDLARPLAVVVVVVAPTLALGLAHLFAEVLEFNVDRSRSPSAQEWRRLVGDASQFLLVAVPPLVMLFVTSILLRQSVNESIQSMLFVGVLSLGFFGWIAGRRSGATGIRLIGATLAGLLIGSIVIGLQLVLKPH